MMYLKDDNLFQIKKTLRKVLLDNWTILFETNGAFSRRLFFLLFYSRKLSGFLMLKIYETVNNDELNM